jgi:hypothetical protein
MKNDDNLFDDEWIADQNAKLEAKFKARFGYSPDEQPKQPDRRTFGDWLFYMLTAERVGKALEGIGVALIGKMIGLAILLMLLAFGAFVYDKYHDPTVTELVKRCSVGPDKMTLRQLKQCNEFNDLGGNK